MDNLYTSVNGSEPSPIAPGALALIGQGNEALANGISSGVGDLSKGVQNWRQQQMQGKAADYLVKSYDQKDPQGNPVNPMLDKMGIHPDQWGTLGARDKAAAVQGMMQGTTAQGQQAEVAAKTSDIQAQAFMRQQQADEQSALGKIAPVLAQMRAASPDKPLAPADVLGAMGKVNMNPREQAVVLRTVLQQMGSDGTSSLQPRTWTDPNGNAFDLYGRTMVNSPPQSTADPSASVTSTPITDENGAVIGHGIRDPKTGALKMMGGTTQKAKTISPAIQTLLTKHIDDFNDTSERLNTSDEDMTAAGLNPKVIKASLTARQKTAVKNGQSLIDTQFKLGNLSADERDGFYQEFGLAAPGGSSASAGNTTTSTAGAGRVPVWKDGKQFTVPAAQRDAAVQQGYSLQPASQ